MHDIIDGHRLVEEENLLVFELSLDLIVVADTSTMTFLKVSRSWGRELGWTKEELTSKPFTHFVHPDDLGATVEKNGDLVEGREVAKFINRYAIKGGGWATLEWNSAVGESNRVIATARVVEKVPESAHEKE